MEWSDASGPVKFTLARAEAWWTRDRNRNLKREVERRLEALALPPGQLNQLLDQWQVVRLDKEVLELLEALLLDRTRDRDLRLEARFRELLDGLDLLLGVAETAKRLAAAVTVSLGASQPTAKEQSSHQTEAILSRLNEVSDQVKESAAVQREEAEAAAARHLQATASSSPVLIGSFAGRDQRTLDALAEKHSKLAAHLADLVQRDDAQAWEALLGVPPTWAVDAPPLFYETVYRLAMGRGLFEVALKASLLESDDLSADRAAALARAANAADAMEDAEEAERYLAEAELVEADHPSVLLQKASMAEVAEERLRLAGAAVPRNDRQRARQAAELAYAHLALGDYDPAVEQAELATRLDPDGQGPEAQHLVRVLVAQRDFPARPTNPQPLIATAAFFEELAATTVAQGRPAVSQLSTSRQALALAVIGERQRAEELIDAAISSPLLLDEARRNYSQAASFIGRPDRALDILPRSGSDGDRYNIASAQVLAQVDVSDAVTELDLLVDSEDSDIAQAAAFSRIIASHDPAISLPEHLAERVEAGDRLLDQARAARAAANEDLVEADRWLAPYDDPTSLALRMSYATDRNQLERAIALAERLLKQRNSGTDRLRLARLKGRARAFRESCSDALAVAENPDETPALRFEGFQLAAHAAHDEGNMPRLEEVATQWRAYQPTDENVWWLVFALLRQRRHQTALELLDDAQPAIADDFHASLWVEATAGLPDTEERLELINQLSERRERSERLEFAFITAALAREDELSAELEARVQQSLSEFSERFPDSELMQTVKVDPDDPGSFINELERLNLSEADDHAEREAALAQTEREVAMGATSLAFLAAQQRRSTIEVLTDGRPLPLAFADNTTSEAEQQAARTAIDKGAATWDSTAVALTSGLPDQTGDLLRRQLLTSRVGQATFDDVSVGLTPLTPHSVSRRATEAARRAEALAHQLELSPDASGVLAGNDPLADTLDETLRLERTPPAFRALAGAISVARNNYLPLYSDDRAARALARSFGVQAFGTPALIRALVEGGEWTHEQRDAVRTEMLRYGAWLDDVTLDDYLALIRDRDRRWNAATEAVFLDERAARQPPNGRLDWAAAALLLISQEAPDRLSEWAAGLTTVLMRVLDQDLVAAVRVLLVKMLMEGALAGAPTPDDYARVIRALRDLPRLRCFTDLPDPLLVTVDDFLGALEGDEKRAVFAHMARRVDQRDRELLIHTFVQVDSSGGEDRTGPDNRDDAV